MTDKLAGTTDSINKNEPSTERARKSRDKAINSGAWRLSGVLPADASAAMGELVDQGYAPSKTQAIRRAIMEASASYLDDDGDQTD